MHTSPAPHTSRTLAAVAGAATVVLTGVAFWLSYEHLHDVATNNGLGTSPARAWAWPATVDLFILIGEVLMLRSSLRGCGMDWWAVTLAGSGSLGSIALNVAGVGEDGDTMEYVVAAVPPVAALLAFGALMRQVHGVLAARVGVDAPASRPAAVAVATPRPHSVPERPAPAVAVATAAPVTTTRGATDTATASAVASATKRPAATAPATSAATPPATKRPAAPKPAATKTPAKGGKGVSKKDAQNLIEPLYKRLGRRPNETEMVAALEAAKFPHTSRAYAKLRRAEIEHDRPELAALGQENVRPFHTGTDG